MNWVKLGCFGVITVGLEQVTFGSSPLTRMAAMLCLVLSGFLIIGLTAYQWGRESAFADMQKFGRAFTRAKEP